jgi:uncharacterized membrane protein
VRREIKLKFMVLVLKPSGVRIEEMGCLNLVVVVVRREREESMRGLVVDSCRN